MAQKSYCSTLHLLPKMPQCTKYSLQFIFVDQEAEYVYEAFLAPPPDTKTEDYMEYPAWLAGESQAFDNSDLNCMDDLLLCKEVLDSCAPLNHSGTNHTSYADLFSNRIEASGNNNVSPEIADLANIELDTPPDFSLSVSFPSYPSFSALLTFRT